MISESSQLEPPLYTVVISEKGGAERRDVFRVAELTVGRVQGNDIVLPKGNVSKRHARILFREGRFIVTDLNSTNGTYVNRRRIAQATIVRDGDKIYIGDFVLQVEPGEASGQASVPILDDGQEPHTTARELESSPAPRVSSLDWDKPSAFEGHRVSSGPPGRPAVSEAPAADRVSTVSHGIDDLAGPHREAVAEVVSAVRRALGEIDVDVARDVRARIESLVSETADDVMLRGAVPTGTSVEAVAAQARSELLELGPLDELLGDPSVTGISLSRHDDIVAQRDDRQVRISPGFSMPAMLELALKRLCFRAGEPLGRDEVVVERRFADGMRLSALLGRATTTGPMLTLHRPRHVAATLDGLVRRGAISRAIATFLSQCVTARCNLLVVGPRDEGSEMLLSALCAAAYRERLVVVSDHDGLALDLGVAHIDLRQGPARKVLEIAGSLPGSRVAIALSTPEVALAALDVLASSIEGIVATVNHADLRRAVTRLPADLCSARPGLSLEAATSWVESSFDVLVEVGRQRDGRVRVRRIAELERSGSGALELKDVFRFNVQRVAAGGAIEGNFSPTGHTPRVAMQLQAAGIALEASMFSRPPSR